jgi:hypothetical protein
MSDGLIRREGYLPHARWAPGSASGRAGTEAEAQASLICGLPLGGVRPSGLTERQSVHNSLTTR